MRYSKPRLRCTRFVVVSAFVGVVVLAGSAAIALGVVGYPADSVTVMTGCLTTSGTSAGNIGSVAVGNNPAKGCGSNQLQIHLSGGTITRVTAGTGVTLAGSGGTGFVNNGFATVGLDPKYQLPQSSCSSGQVVASDGAGGWSCQSQKTYSGSDFALSNQSCESGQFLTGFDSSGVKTCAADRTYSNGSGLDLTGNVFSLASSFALPQKCSSGQVPTSDGGTGWTCGSAGGAREGVSDLTDYIFSAGNVLGADDTETADVFCNSGDIATGGGWSVDGAAGIVEAGPLDDNGREGWSATASTGITFDTSHVVAYVKCLTTLR